MATVGQLIYSNDNSSKSLYDSDGARIQLAPLCLTITDEVVAVDNLGRPTILIKKISGFSGGTTPIIPTIPADAWLDENNEPILDENSDYILI